MEGVVKKWGNSLGIRVPNFIVRNLSLRDGSPIVIRENGNEIIIKPIEKIKLSDMINKINKDNIHKEIETTGPVGNEVW